MSRRAVLAPLITAVALVLSACAGMPTSGPVVETRDDGGVSAATGTSFDPKPPQEGADRADIVRGFLVAMTAYPIQTNTAKEFLTPDAAEAWTPDKMITYSGYPPVRESATGVTVTLGDPNWLDAQGAWQGPLPRAERTIEFELAFVDGEWRIDEAPDALIVPQTWFAQRFRQVSLYYFDPTALILAPEPVFVPTGKQLATALTEALLLGPGERLDRIVQTFIPAGLTVNLSVQISDQGIADLQLTGDAGQLTPEKIDLMLAQLGWTLRQEPKIKAIRVAINGRAMPLPDGVSAYDVNGGGEFDPAGLQASPLLFALQGGLLASGTAGEFAPVSGPFGAAPQGLRSVGVSLSAAEVAGVSTDGTRVLTGPVDGGPEDKPQVPVAGARNLLPPAWDHADLMWLVDRRPAGAVVSWVGDGRAHVLDVPGISGEQVRSFVVSRDGTRLVAVVRRPTGDRLVVSRIAHDLEGRVLFATPARQISDEPDSDFPVRAIAWQSPTSLAVLSPFPSTTSLAQLDAASVDGSPVTEGASTIEGRFGRLAGSPAENEPLYGVARGSLVNLGTADRQSVALAEDTTSITYVG